MRKLLFLLLATGMFLLYGCKEKLVTIADNHKTIHLSLNQSLMVELPGNADSDSSWRKIEFNNSVLISKGSGNYTISEKSYVMEEQGIYHFRFLAVNPGSSRLYMEYGNKYDDDESPGKIFEIKIVVEKE